MPKKETVSPEQKVDERTCSGVLKAEGRQQFLMNYDYEFLCYLKTLVTWYRSLAGYGADLIAQTVMEELVLYLIMEESEALFKN